MTDLSDLSDLFRKCDAHVSKAARAYEGRISCKAGCSSCCQQLVFITYAEARHIVERHHQMLADHAETLAAQTKLAMAKRGPAAYWGNRCVFLDDGGLCRIYSDRPFACRVVLVTSAAELCAKPEAHVRKIAMAHVGHNFMMQADDATGLPYAIGPMPAMLQLAMQSFQEEANSAERADRADG